MASLIEEKDRDPNGRLADEAIEGYEEMLQIIRGLLAKCGGTSCDRMRRARFPNTAIDVAMRGLRPVIERMGLESLDRRGSCHRVAPTGEAGASTETRGNAEEIRSQTRTHERPRRWESNDERKLRTF